MKRLLIVALAVAAVVATVNLLAGCSTIGNGQLDLDTGAVIESAAAGASGDYAKALSKIYKAVEQKKAVADPLAGYAFSRTYFVEGVPTEAAKISWRDEWTRTGNAGKQDVPVTSEGAASTTPTTSEDEALAAEIAEILTSMGLAE